MATTAWRQQNSLGPRSIDLAGRQFGNLLVLSLAEGRSRTGDLRWLCQCRCGHRVVINGAWLRSGHVTRCPHCAEYRRRLEPMEGRARRAYQTYKNRARQRESVFDLTRDEFVALVLQPCHYCGANSLPNGVDRVDNERGYMLSNVVPCCKVCNRAKNTMGYDDFLDWLDQVAFFRIKGGSE